MQLINEQENVCVNTGCLVANRAAMQRYVLWMLENAKGSVARSRHQGLINIEALKKATSPAGRRRHRHDVRLVFWGGKGRLSSDGGASAVLRVEVGYDVGLAGLGIPSS
jgi:hypothetical protein